MKKIALLSIFLLSFLFLCQTALADDVNFTVDVTSPIPPMPIFQMLTFGIGGLILSAGGLLFLLRAFIGDFEPKDKIKMMIAGFIVISFIVIAVGVIWA